MRQLGLDGSESSNPTRMRPLTQRQREIVAYMRAVGAVRPCDVGAMMRAGRSVPLRRGAGRHVSSDGVDALRRLERRGLVVHVCRGRWVVAVSRVEAWT